MVMAEYYIQDRLQELWQQIHHLHLTYLDTEDSPQKIDQRNKLEACIREYLCIAPHNRKFYCPETAEVLHRSANSKKDFSGYRAALAWNAVSMYAGNLLSQPWRKEYRQIKTYCGFYKHQIDMNLVGAEAMFEAMGYKHVGDGILLLEGPVCPDRVANVSQDSIMAFVECQILKTIWEEVSNNFKVSWLDVLEFRESHLCSPEQSIRTLNYQYHERRFQEQQAHNHRSFPSHGAESYSTMLRYNPPAPAAHPSRQSLQQQPHIVSHVPPLTGMHSFPPTAPHITSHYSPHVSNQHLPQSQCSGQCIYSSNPYYNNYGTYAPPPMQNYPRYGTLPFQMGCPPKQNCNGYCYPNGCVPNQYICPVPTGQLIELDSSQNGVYDQVDSAAKRQQDTLKSHKQLAKSTNLDSLTLSKSKEDGAGTFESWDFVYRNLESQGYNKDLGERPDVLHQMTDKRKQQKKMGQSIELEDEFNNLGLNLPSPIEKPLKINEALKRFDEQKNLKVDNIRVAQSSSYDNITSQDSFNHNSKTVSNHKVTNGVGNRASKTLPRETGSRETVSPNHLTLDAKKLRSKVELKPKPLKTKDKLASEPTSWNCNTCTYLNSPSVDICTICGKSKKNVEVNMAVGGSECPLCTLVNPKEVAKCQACNTSLINSPTYI